LLEETISLVQPLADKAKVELSVADTDAKLTLPAADSELRQVISNLVINAIQAMPHGGAVRLSAERYDEGTPRVEIEVHDEGIGIDAEHREQIFEPFVTTKGAGVGTGLGLWASRLIVREHGGEIAIRDTSTQGTTFVVTLPTQRT
jgi:signal transduction histidine kinase